MGDFLGNRHSETEKYNFLKMWIVHGLRLGNKDVNILQYYNKNGQSGKSMVDMLLTGSVWMLYRGTGKGTSSNKHASKSRAISIEICVVTAKESQALPLLSSREIGHQAIGKQVKESQTLQARV